MPVSRAFRKAYPAHAARAAALGVHVAKTPGPNGAWFIEGDYQVTGYQTRVLRDGSHVPWTADDDDWMIRDTLDKIEQGRAINAAMTAEQRFERALAELLTIKVRHRMICSWADYGGDHASVADWHGGGLLDCGIWLGKEEVARAKVRTLADAEQPLRAAFAAREAGDAA